MAEPWRRIMDARVYQQAACIPDEETRAAVAAWILKMEKNPKPAHHSAPIRGVQRGWRLKVGDWRVLYLVLPDERAFYIGDVVPRNRYTYSKVRLATLARMSRRNPVLAERIDVALGAHPAWGDVLVAEAAGCSPAAVRRQRIARGQAARHALPWLHGSSR